MKLRLSFAMVLFLSSLGFGQQVINNLPSADLVDKGHVFLRADTFLFETSNYIENFNFAVGVTRHLEFDVNTVGLGGDDEQIQYVPGFKYVPYKGEHLALFIDDQVSQTFRGGLALANLVYGAAAYTDGKARFTGGLFNSQDSVARGNRTGAMLGFEYTAKVFNNGGSLGTTVDWASGNGANGYLTPGLMWMVNKRFSISPGYQIGNHDPNRNRAASLMMGYMF